MMDIIFSILENLIFNTMGGVLLAMAVAYFLAKVIRKIFPKFPKPETMMGLAFLIGLLTIPSIPKYSFENDTFAKLEGMTWVKIVNENYESSILDPVTWFKKPLNSIYFVQPANPLLGHTGYQEIFLKYGEEDEVHFADPNCEDKTVHYSTPDSKGVVRYVSPLPGEMEDHHFSLYCEHDWSVNEEKLRQFLLKEVEKNKDA